MGRRQLTTGGVARRLGISTVRVLQLVAAGKLRSSRTETGWHTYDPKEVERLVDERLATARERAK
jgi:hypothetical protein